MTDDLSRAEIEAGVKALLGYRLFCADERCSCVTERERFECICDPPEVVVEAILAAASRVREERGFVIAKCELVGCDHDFQWAGPPAVVRCRKCGINNRDVPGWQARSFGPPQRTADNVS